LAVLSVCSEEELEESSSEESTDVDSDGADTRTIADLALTPSEIAQRRQQIKNKILAVGRMQRVFNVLRQEAEQATELSSTLDVNGQPMGTGGSAFGVRMGPDALSVHGNQYIRNFDEARQSDIANERLPEFNYDSGQVVAVPSMRTRLPGDNNMEDLIKKALEEEEDEAGTVERLADRIARGRKPQGRPRALKRFETA